VHEVHGGHQAICIEILEQFMKAEQYVSKMPNYQINTNGCLTERKLCGTTFTLDFSTLGEKITNKDKTCTHCNSR
jgi:hypothetical protein